MIISFFWIYAINGTYINTRSI